jgi:hypothetical protein
VGLKQRLSDGVLVHRLDGVMEAADVDELHGGGEGVVEVAEEGVLIHEKVHDSERWDQMGSWLATMMVCERGTRDGVDGDAGESSISLEVGHHVWPAAGSDAWSATRWWPGPRGCCRSGTPWSPGSCKDMTGALDEMLEFFLVRE